MHHISSDDKSKKAAIRFSIYGVLGVILVGLTIISVLAAQGFDYDPQTGEVIKNGLIFVDSKPVSAEISVNNVAENDRTPGRLPLPNGEYEIELSANKYRQWKRTVTVEAQNVLRVDYAVLVPEEVVITETEKYDDLILTEQNPVNGQILILKEFSPLNFDVFESDKPQESPRQLILPNNVARDVSNKSKFKFIGWSSDGEKALLEHSRGASLADFILVDTKNGQESLNVEDALDFDIDYAQFEEGDGQKLIVRAKDKLRQADMEQFIISAPIATNVNDFVQSDGGIVYTELLSDSTRINFLQNDLKTEVKSYPSAKRGIKLVPGEFENEPTLTIWNKQNNQVELYVDPYSRAKEGKSLSPEISLKQPRINDVQLSANSRMIMIRNGVKIFVYDQEYDDLHSFNLGIPRSSLEHFRWIDGARFIYADGKAISVVDFEGSNRYELAKADSTHAPFFGKDFKFLLFTQTENKAQTLKAANMVVDN